MIKRFVKKIVKGDQPTNRTREYWEKEASKPVETVIKRICTDFDRESFETKKESLIFFMEIPFNSELKVLDLACGMGRTCKWVAPKVREYVGADFIPAMIEKAKKYNADYSNAKFVVNDGKTLNIFEDESFDIVYSDLAFQHMFKNVQTGYSHEVHRVLKKGGVFYVQIPRIEYYKDETFSLTEKEYKSLMQDFSIVEQKTTDAYYFVKAQKTI